MCKVLMTHEEVLQLLKDGYDMPKGWCYGNNQPLWHQKVRNMWKHMWIRCYDISNPRNKDYECSIIYDDFKVFSKYLDWFMRQPLFEEFCRTCDNIKWSIDKDIKCEGNKHYLPQYMTLCTLSDNVRQRNKTYDWTNANTCFKRKDIQEKCARHKWKPIIGIKDNNIVLFKALRFSQNKGFDPSTIVKCIKGKHKTHKGYKWLYVNYKHNQIYRRVIINVRHRNSLRQ